MRARDEAVLEAFVAARSDELLRTAVPLTRNRGRAEDLSRATAIQGTRRPPAGQRLPGPDLPRPRRGVPDRPTRRPHGPAGTALLDRVVVVRALGGTRSARRPPPSGGGLRRPGAVLGALPLEEGAGTGPLAVATTTARLPTADGTVVAEVPIERVE